MIMVVYSDLNVYESMNITIMQITINKREIHSTTHKATANCGAEEKLQELFGKLVTDCGFAAPENLALHE